jgi:hypothetical protein
MNPILYDCTRPYAVIHLERDSEDDSVYRVIRKEGLDIPDLFSKPLPEVYFEGDYLILGFDWQDFDEHWEYSLLTTHPDALGRTEINPFNPDETKTRIARFTLSPNNRTCISYNEDGIILEFSEDLRTLYLRAYKGMESCTKNLLDIYELGLLEDKVT